MKILLLTTHLNFGGISTYTVSLAKALKRRGHEVLVASNGGVLDKELISSGVRHIKVPINTKSEISPKLFLTVLILLRFLKKEKIDIIHAQTRVTQVLAFYLSAFLKVPYVTTCHGFFKPKIQRRLFKFWGDKVIAISEPVKEHLVNSMNVKETKTKVIYNGIDINKFSVNLSEIEKKELKKKIGLKDGPIIGTISRFSPVKGHEYLLIAMKTVLSKKTDAQLLIVGDGPTGAKLIEQVGGLNIGEKVFFTESTLEIWKPLSIMDIFVLPSLQEGLGLAIIEAQACGLPVIASDVGGICTVIKHGENGLLVQPKDSESLSKAIIFLLENKNLATTMGQRGKELVIEKFSLEKMTDEVGKLYKETINPNFGVKNY